MSEKTEQPTDKKLRDARAEGQVAKSSELTVLAQLATILAMFLVQGKNMYEMFQGLFNVTIASINLPLNKAWAHIGKAAGEVMFRVLVPMFSLLLVVTVLSIVAQTGFMLAPKAMKPKASKLNPLTNAKQMVSLKNLFEFGKSVLKVTVLTSIFYVLMKKNLGSFQFMPVCGIECGMSMTLQMITWMWTALVIFYFVIGAADFAFQKRTVLKQLMMTKEEVKQEYKNAEGNQEVKQERKRTHQEIQSGSLASNVKKSTVVVRNPTHIAICIYYKTGDTPLPRVLERGEDALAQHIVQLAEKAGVPIIENISVARALNRSVERGGYIPPEMFGPVAEILRFVDEMSDGPLDEL